MELGDIQRGQEIIGLLEILRRLTPHAHNHVHPNEGIREELLDETDFTLKQLSVVTSVHETEHCIAATLQWDMKMGHECPALGAITDKVVGDEIGLKATDTETLYAFHLIECTHEIEERLLGVLSEITNIHTGEHDFLATFCGSIPRLFDE